MLRNVTNKFIKNKYLRNNKTLSPFFVTQLNVNSVYYQKIRSQTKIPKIRESDCECVGRLWKTRSKPVEMLWNL